MTHTNHKLRSEAWYGGWARYARERWKDSKSLLIKRNAVNVKRFIKQEVDELFAEKQLEDRITFEANKLRQQVAEELEQAWSDFSSDNWDDHYYDPYDIYAEGDDIYWFDAREAYAVKDYLSGKWNPQEEEEDEYPSWLDEDADDDYDYDPFHFAPGDSLTPPPPPSPRRAITRRYAAIKGKR